MRAYLVDEFGIENLRIEEWETPDPGPTEVLLKIHAASLNYRDLMVVTGTYNPKMKRPAVPLSDGAGEVVAVGEKVTRWKTGDRVMPIFAQKWFDGRPTNEIRKTSLGAGSYWHGVLRDYAVFDEEGLVAIPEHLSYEEASTLPCAALTAWNALSVSGGLKAGDTVLTQGTGGVSIFAVQIAKLFGARVIATSSSSDKIERLKKLGADETINYKETPDWDKPVLEMTGGRGVDHVVEVGGAGTLPRSLKSVRLGGHIAMIGALTGAATFDPIGVFMKAVRLQGIFVGSRSMFEDLCRAVIVGKLRPVVDRTFGFDEAKDALRYMEGGSHFGKIVITFGEADEGL
jgi:NADPH:quinone reductase-like Zn-dependent oxidoreductase